jgi:glycosyltransferase involved in cell wall biosynthesis
VTRTAGSPPLVSVVTPSLDQGAFIGRCLSSVHNQDYSPVEHIVVDGGSTDQTLDVLRSYEGTYGIRWLSEPDRGMYEAVNKGVRLARGDILAYLNADDAWFRWTVRAAVERLTMTPAPLVVYGDAVHEDAATGESRLVFYPPFDEAYLRRTGFLCQPTVFWRRELVERIGEFDESYSHVADCDYWLRAASAGRVVKLDEVLAIEHTHPAAKRRAQAREVQEEIRAVRTRHGARTGVAGKAARLRDRAWAYVWRRRKLLRFVRSASRSGRDGWTEFLGDRPGMRISRRRTLAALLPLTQGRFFAGLVTSARSGTPKP